MIIIERVKLLINEKQKSTNAFLIDIGFIHNFMQDLEKGKKPNSEKISKMAKYFNVTADYLLGLSDNRSLCNCYK